MPHLTVCAKNVLGPSSIEKQEPETRPPSLDTYLWPMKLLAAQVAIPAIGCQRAYKAPSIASRDLLRPRAFIRVPPARADPVLAPKIAR
jgi:hypothetical protein